MTAFEILRIPIELIASRMTFARLHAINPCRAPRESLSSQRKSRAALLEGPHMTKLSVGKQRRSMSDMSSIDLDAGYSFLFRMHLRRKPQCVGGFLDEPGEGDCKLLHYNNLKKTLNRLCEFYCCLLLFPLLGFMMGSRLHTKYEASSNYSQYWPKADDGECQANTRPFQEALHPGRKDLYGLIFEPAILQCCHRVAIIQPHHAAY